MVTILEHYVQCDECHCHLSYDPEDIEISWNWNHKFQAKYLKCPNPKCGNDIFIEKIE